METDKKDNVICEHEDCKEKAKWLIKSHAFGLVSFDHYYCHKHFNLHIDYYKLVPSEDIIRLGY